MLALGRLGRLVLFGGADEVKSDMDLLRLVLLEMEERYRCVALVNLAINAYSMENVVYHCQLARYLNTSFGKSRTMHMKSSASVSTGIS